MLQGPEDDSSLLNGLRRRDPQILSAIVGEHARPLYRMARGLGFNNEEAEDLVQDVFEVFLQTLDRFEGRSKLRTWLFGILHNKMRERRRAMQREELSDPIDANFESWFDRKGHWARDPDDLERLATSAEISKTLEHCLESLTLQQREVFLLREVEELDTKDICKNLEISVTHMGVLLHRARHKLRECLRAKGWN